MGWAYWYSEQTKLAIQKLTLLHALTDVPVNEGALRVHEVELVVHAGEHLRDGGGVRDHAAGALHLGQVTTGHHGRGLVVDAALEASGAPVDELDGALGLDGGDGGVHVLRHDVATVHHAAGHVLTVTRVALGHHVRTAPSRASSPRRRSPTSSRWSSTR